jgi:uncharacterized protein YkuJ
MRFRLFDDMIIIKRDDFWQEDEANKSEEKKLNDIWQYLMDINFFTKKEYIRVRDREDKFSEQSLETLNSTQIKAYEHLKSMRK